MRFWHTCRKKTVCAYEHDGALFHTKEERDSYIEERKLAEAKEVLKERINRHMSLVHNADYYDMPSKYSEEGGRVSVRDSLLMEHRYRKDMSIDDLIYLLVEDKPLQQILKELT